MMMAEVEDLVIRCGEAESGGIGSVTKEGEERGDGWA